MNQKTAKQLRKLSKSMATEAFSTKYLGNSKRFVFQTEELTADEAANKLSGGDIAPKLPKVVSLPGTYMVNPNSARGVYKQLKKAAKQRG